MDRQIVKVYVREGAHEGERTLSFKPPKEVPQAEWLRRGFAIDGNSVLAYVTPKTAVSDEGVIHERSDFVEAFTAIIPSRPRTPVQALREVESWLVKWLNSLGYDVEFS